jgi:hypothetical protein
MHTGNFLIGRWDDGFAETATGQMGGLIYFLMGLTLDSVQAIQEKKLEISANWFRTSITSYWQPIRSKFTTRLSETHWKAQHMGITRFAP